MTNIREEKDPRTSDLIIEKIEFNVIFVATFIVLLVGAALALMLPWKWSHRVASSEGRWLVARAWHDAGLFTDFAFMG